MSIRRLTFFWFALIPLARAADPPSVEDNIRDAGRAWLEDHEGVGLTIGVYVAGDRRFYNFGTTQLDGNKPPTKDTVYEIGPLSKTMSAQLLARAIIEARATLNDEAARYLDEDYSNLENGGQKVLLLHLVNGTSQL